VSLELVTSLLDALGTIRAKDVVQGFEGILGEDDESANVATWGKLQEVESVHVADVDTWQVAGTSLDVLVGVSVNDEGTLAEDEAGVSVLALTRASAFVVASTVEIACGTSSIESTEKSLSVVAVEAINNHWEFWNIVDSVTASHNESTNGGSSKSRGNGVSVLVHVGLSVPPSPDLERGEHAALAAHVTESTLAGS